MSTNSIRVSFLGSGTSSGVPMIACPCQVCSSPNPKDKRLRSSVMIESENTKVVIDTTPDFRYQMLRTNTRKLDAIIYTHPHKDHIAGLDDVRAFNFFSGKPMDIYANYLTEEALRRDFYYAFEDKRYPGIPELQIHTITDSDFWIGDLHIVPVPVWHLKMPVLGFRIGGFTYITDANRIDSAQKEKIRGSDTIVLNALRREKHISHFNLDEAIELVQELEIPNAWFTHVSHQMGLHDEVVASMPPGISLAYDGLSFDVKNPLINGE